VLLRRPFEADCTGLTEEEGMVGVVANAGRVAPTEGVVAPGRLANVPKT